RRALPPRRAPALRAHGAAWCGASPCPRRGVREETAWARGARRLAEPPGWDAVLAGFFLEIGHSLGVQLDLLLHAIELAQRALPIGRHDLTLCRIVPGRKVRGEAVDPALKRFGKQLRPIERV